MRSDLVSRAGADDLCTKHLIEVLPSLPPRKRCASVSEYGSESCSNDLETHRFPRAVPFKKGAGMCVREHGASMCGARVRGRDEEERKTATEEDFGHFEDQRETNIELLRGLLAETGARTRRGIWRRARLRSRRCCTNGRCTIWGTSGRSRNW